MYRVILIITGKKIAAHVRGAIAGENTEPPK